MSFISSQEEYDSLFSNQFVYYDWDNDQLFVTAYKTKAKQVFYYGSVNVNQKTITLLSTYKYIYVGKL